MNTKTTMLAGALCAGFATAQVQDVALEMISPTSPVIFGQQCGPVTCTPLSGSTVAAGQSRTLVHYGQPVSFYAIALGFPGLCLPIPGFDNVLLLDSPVILGFGVTSTPPFVPLPCQQGFNQETLTLPPGTPPGIVFRVQSLGISVSGPWAFSNAIEATTI